MPWNYHSKQLPLKITTLHPSYKMSDNEYVAYDPEAEESEIEQIEQTTTEELDEEGDKIDRENDKLYKDRYEGDVEMAKMKPIGFDKVY
ncbi:hypothetical protein NW768_010032 [Fusarium equiseti]|uniref:Uncharacterized protein n=1 Tax=Fusarium equiseti TaxID=61235 RepID=A0ABQ8R1K4_FUSEQ|nr:hypothetical protein NW768_010032 [Fusarium equiseti]